MSDPVKPITEVAAKAASDLAEGVSALAAAIKQGTPHAWDVMVRQQVIEGITGLTTFIVGFFAMVWFARTAKIVSNTKDSKGHEVGYVGREEPSPALPFFLVSGAIGAVLTFQAFFRVPDYVGKIVNPEFYAGELLIESIRK